MNFNEARDSVMDGSYVKRSSEDLKAMLLECNANITGSVYDVAKISFVIGMIQSELKKRRDSELHEQLIAEQKRLHELQIQHVDRVQSDSSKEEGQRHTQTQLLSKIGIVMAFGALMFAVISLVHDIWPNAFESSKPPAHPEPKQMLPVKPMPASTVFAPSNFLQSLKLDLPLSLPKQQQISTQGP